MSDQEQQAAGEAASIGEQQRAIIKADVIGISQGSQQDAGGKAGMSNKLDDDPFTGMYDNDVIAPPYDAQLLTTIVEQSSILPQCVEAMETNVDGFGHTFEPHSWIKKDQASGKYPKEAEDERKRLKRFFDYCNTQESFTKLRRKMRQDYETVGYGFFEVIRTASGDVGGLEHLPAYTMRLCKTDPGVIDIEMTMLDEDGQEEKVIIPRRFRRFVQSRDARKVYYKEFGDPRDLDAISGKWLNEVESKAVRATGYLPDRTSKARIATEVLYFTNYSSRTPYGMPRWIGALPGILGERAADEVNLLFFDNKGVPPLAILVSGRMASDSKKTIEQHIEKNIKGKNNFHNILLIEVETPPNPMAGGSQKSSVDIKPLTEAIQKDALFREYRKDARDNARSSMRLPKIYVGETDDYNRATADASRDVAEEQVFAPERDDFDFMLNRVLMPALHVRYWKFKTLAPTQDNAEKLSALVVNLSKAGLTPREARIIMGEIFNKDLTDPANAQWLDEPMEVFLERLRQGLTPEQIQLADQKAAQAMEQAKVLAQGQQQPGANDPQPNGPQAKKPAAVAKSEGLTELALMLVELRKQVLELEGPVRTY